MKELFGTTKGSGNSGDIPYKKISKTESQDLERCWEYATGWDPGQRCGYRVDRLRERAQRETPATLNGRGAQALAASPQPARQRRRRRGCR